MVKSLERESIQKLTRIGVFYDGNYFYHVSNYYNYVHERQSRISIAGLHNFIRQKAAEFDGSENAYNHCQIVDAHYFRGRLNAMEASQKGNQLYYERVFDDILMSEGVTTHYFPVRSINGQRQDSNVDVWMALEAFEMSLYKKFDILVLIASDGNYVPLVRKLNTLGTRVMLLSWEFEFKDDYGNQRITKTSQDLQDVVTYPISMDQFINRKESRDKYLIDSLFVPKETSTTTHKEPVLVDFGNEDVHESTILSVKSGYGFIKFPPTNLFFHFQSVNGCDFSDLQIGDTVRFKIARNEKGDDVAIDVELVE
jgi:uncharacterized LabA/DUF88 family protein/cold shock CspA family protein